MSTVPPDSVLDGHMPPEPREISQSDQITSPGCATTTESLGSLPEHSRQSDRLVSFQQLSAVQVLVGMHLAVLAVGNISSVKY